MVCYNREELIKNKKDIMSSSPENYENIQSSGNQDWESLHDQSMPPKDLVDAAQKYNLRLADKESVLTSVTDGSGRGRDITGWAFAEDRALIAPVERSNGEIQTGWMGVGVTTEWRLNPESGQREQVSYYVMMYNDGEKDLVKLVPVEELDKLSARLVQDNDPENQSDTGPRSDSRQVQLNPEKENKPGIEDVFNSLSKEDQDSLNSFADYAWRKRTAQLEGRGEDSSEYSSRMGEYLKKMSPKAIAIAYNYAYYRYGEGRVAF